VSAEWSRTRCSSRKMTPANAGCWSSGRISHDEALVGTGHLWCLQLESKYWAEQVEEDLNLEIIDARVNEVHPGSFGEVHGGSISARGTTWPTAIKGKGNKASICFPLSPITFRFEADEARDWDIGSPCLILRITALYAKGASRKRAGPYICFLVAEALPGGGDRFRRVGHIRIDKSRDEDDELMEESEIEWSDEMELERQLAVPGHRRTLVLCDSQIFGSPSYHYFLYVPLFS